MDLVPSPIDLAHARIHGGQRKLPVCDHPFANSALYQRGQRRNRDHAKIGTEGQPLGHPNSDAEPRERTGPNADCNGIQLPQMVARLSQQSIDGREQKFIVAPHLVDRQLLYGFITDRNRTAIS